MSLNQPVTSNVSPSTSWHLQRHLQESTKIQGLVHIVHFIPINKWTQFACLCKLFKNIFTAFINLQQYDISFGAEYQSPVKVTPSMNIHDEPIVPPIPKPFEYITQNIYSIHANTIYPSCDCKENGCAEITNINNINIGNKQKNMSMSNISNCNKSTCNCANVFGNSCNYSFDTKSKTFVLESIVTICQNETNVNTSKQTSNNDDNDENDENDALYNQCNVIVECNQNCKCFENFSNFVSKNDKLSMNINYCCNNNITQRNRIKIQYQTGFEINNPKYDQLNEIICKDCSIGENITLYLKYDINKHWCVYTKNFIQKGQFIVEFVGEILNKKEFIQRQKIYEKSGINYMLTFGELTMKSGKTVAVCQTFVDPFVYGNVARFINHSCDANSKPEIVRYGCDLPHICMFAIKDILPNQEITFSYGWNGNSSNTKSKFQCFCQSSNCCGYLPHNEV